MTQDSYPRNLVGYGRTPPYAAWPGGARIAVQCVLNALFDLKTVFFLSSPFAPSVPTDAVNMSNATGFPAILWAGIWIVAALGILWFAMRLYVAGRDKGYQPDLPFEETPPI